MTRHPWTSPPFTPPPPARRMPELGDIVRILVDENFPALVGRAAKVVGIDPFGPAVQHVGVVLRELPPGWDASNYDELWFYGDDDLEVVTP